MVAFLDAQLRYQNSVDPRYNSIKNLPPDLRMKLRETVRQKIDKKDAVNTYMVNNPDVQPPSYYKSPTYNTNASQNAQGKNSLDFTNPYKQLPFNEAFYQVINKLIFVQL